MRKKLFIVFFTAVILLVLLSCTAFADGGLIGKNGRDIYEPEQKAVILFRDGVEELNLSVRYDGAAEEFAWLVPTPEPPRIEKGNAVLFELMSALTPEATGDVREGWSQGYITLGSSNGVEELYTRTVGPYDTTVVRSDSATDLQAWLEERGFAYDKQAETVLADYIERGWCFTAMRINPSSVSDVGYQLSDGVIDPLRFIFHAEQPVYPLYISSLNPGSTEVLLYVLGPEAYTSKAMRLNYAEAWEPVQIGALKEFSSLAAELEKDGGCYITKLRRTFYPEKMEDIYLYPAEDYVKVIWPGLTLDTVVGGLGDYFPWWELLAAALILAVVVAALYGSYGTDIKTGLKKRVAVLLSTALAVFIALLPLGLLISQSERSAAASPGTVQPWNDEILVERNGFSELVHPDGRIEVLGLSRELARLTASVEPGLRDVFYVGDMLENYFHADLEWASGKMDGDGGWKWSVVEHRFEEPRTVYLKVYNSVGESYEVDLGMMPYVHAVRLSPQGDRLWMAANPGVPVNATEVREYAFPSLEFKRTLVHDACLRDGEIILSADGEPLLAGHFEWGEGDEYGENDCYGFLPMLEENAEFVGDYLEIDRSVSVEPDEDGYYAETRYGEFCDAVDGSPFLLISVSADATVSSAVLDTRDGTIYQVGEGSPIGWR